MFRRTLPDQGLEITKTYRLAKTPEGKLADSDFPSYHLEFDIQVKNIGDRPHKVAYRLDGPNGLPREGWWYANKVSRTWCGVGLRDLIVKFDEGETQTVGCPKIPDGKSLPPWRERLTFIGVDAQYFSAILIPQGEVGRRHFRVDAAARRRRGSPAEEHHERLLAAAGQAAGVEARRNDQRQLQALCRPEEAAAAGRATSSATCFITAGSAGSRSRCSGRSNLFYSVLRNYGLAIVLLTVVVRLCMFPFSRKQALGAQKMQEIQPEIKKLQEKYKNNMEARTKAQQELFRKHNYNPMSGCLVLFIQLPIFMGLYRSLMVDVELRNAPLIARGGPLVLEPGRPGHALRLASVHAGVRQQRHRHVRPRARISTFCPC